MSEKIAVGILGATGTVGQRFIELLENHPLFYIKAFGASNKSSGKSYVDACAWKMTTPPPERIAQMQVMDCEPELFVGCRVIFSGLDSSVAGEIELAFLKADYVVFSNAKNHRMNPMVPLIVPVVNPEHFDLIHEQRKAFGIKKGFLVTNANCSTTGLVAALKPLQDAFGPLKNVVVVTMQAISGAGYPGVPSMDILGNVVPYIADEEAKMESEALKILGKLSSDGKSISQLSGLTISATCNRVAVLEGHTESVFVQFQSKKPSIEEVKAALTGYRVEAQEIGCNSAPKQCINVMEQKDRPQPRLDVMLENGNGLAIGGLRSCPIFGLKFTLLVHNTILGAAGSAIMNAEIAYKKNLL